MQFKIQAIEPQSRHIRTLMYNNETSVLLDEAGKSLVKVVEVMQRRAAPITSQETPLAKQSPRVLKISLGLSCNYECEYCSQRFVPRTDETNPGDVRAFIDRLDSWVKQPPEKIEFWGGEPLVYVKTLRPLAEALRQKYPDSEFGLITNGSLLNPELNQWIDRLGFGVGISHDGPGQFVRGPDPLQNPAQRAAILDLYERLAPQGRISFNAMINRENTSRAAIQEFFIELTGDGSVKIGEGGFVDAYDEGGESHSLIPKEFAPFRNKAFSEIRTGRVSNFVGLSNKLSGFINSLRTARPAIAVGQKCAMDSPDNVAVDLKGNVLTCQNVSAVSFAPNGENHRLGHVSDLQNAKLKTATHWSKRQECPRCPMLQICQGSCMFLEGKLWDVSCDNAFSDAVPVFAAGIEFLTGLVPIHIDGPQRDDRKDIFGLLNKDRPPREQARPKSFPIRVVSA